MNYTILSANGYDALNAVEHNVRRMIARGWKPVGGITLAYSEHSGFYAAQAMVFEKKEEQSK